MFSMFSLSTSQLESISDPEETGMLALGWHSGIAGVIEMGVLAQRACLCIADSGILLPGAEDTGVLVCRGRLSDADGGVLHPEASPGLVVPHKCVGVEDVLGTGDIGALSLSSPDPVGMLVRCMGGFDVDVDMDVDMLGSGFPLRIHLHMEQRCCKVRGGDLCGSSSGNSKESSDNAAFSAKEESV